MADRPVKRPRASSNSDATLAITDPARLAKLPKLLDTLDEKTVRSFLLIAAQESSRIGLLVESESIRLENIEKAKVVDFDYHSKSVWRTLNVEYKRLKASRQWEEAGDAYHSVKSEIEDIKNRCPAHASYVTKYSALETLRKIGKIICLSNDGTLGQEVQKSFSEDSVLEDTMFEIVEGMTTEEREDMMREPQGDMLWVEKLKELKGLAADCDLFEELDGVISLLEGAGNRTHTSRDQVEVLDLT